MKIKSCFLFYVVTVASGILVTSFQSQCAKAQGTEVWDDFEGNGTIASWTGDDCEVVSGFVNPHLTSENSSSKVLRYRDIGGQYANVRFEVPAPFNLTQNRTFRFKIYVPSAGLSGIQPHQVSLKLQDGNQASPWASQCEIIKPIMLDQWQEISFDFFMDNWVNLDPASVPPIQRTDFNRVVIQVNGENNNHQVLAYLDDFEYDGHLGLDPVFGTLVWADEFDQDGPVDSGRWFHQTQLPAGGSWFNGELQHYTNRTENSFVSNGSLKIMARRENFSDQGQLKAFTSARLNSKFAFKQGRVEFRAKLPVGTGTWPALWTLGKNILEPGAYWFQQGSGSVSWPACGEIDVMEHWGSNLNFVQSATHTPSSFGSTINKGGRMVSTATSAFHVYSLDWYPNRLVFKVDGQIHYVYNPLIKNAETWPFQSDHYLLMNLAIEPGISQAFSQAAMEVDYVRIYQTAPTEKLPLKTSRELKIFPNPAGHYLNLILPTSAYEWAELEIQNLFGKTAFSEYLQINGNHIRLNHIDKLPSGLYSGRLRTRQMEFPFRFVIQ